MTAEETHRHRSDYHQHLLPPKLALEKVATVYKSYSQEFSDLEELTPGPKPF